MPIGEVIVVGTPVSLQGSPRARDKWKQRVSAATTSAIRDEDRLEYGVVDDVAVWILYFHFGEMSGDLDNIAKFVLDGMSSIAWSSDRQIARLTLRRIRLDPPRPAPITDAPPLVRDAVARAMLDFTEFVYVRFEPDRVDGRVP